MRFNKHRTPTPVSCIVQEGIVRLRWSPASCGEASYAYAGLLHRARRCRTPTQVSCIVHEGVVRLRRSPASCREASYAYDQFLDSYIAPATHNLIIPIRTKEKTLQKSEGFYRVGIISSRKFLRYASVVAMALQTSQAVSTSFTSRIRTIRFSPVCLISHRRVCAAMYASSRPKASL